MSGLLHTPRCAEKSDDFLTRGNARWLSLVGRPYILRTGGNVAQLSLDKLHAVIGLARGYIDRNDSLMFETVGTGFIYAYPELGSEGNKQYGGWLVTCKHVVEGIGKSSNHVIVRHNREGNGEMMPFHTSIRADDGQPRWRFHPSADIAVHRADPENLERNNVEWMALAHGYTRAEAESASLLEGDGVFIIGFPQGWVEGQRDYPVVRQGIIAQIRGWYNQEHQTFLVDGSGFKGNSGGPVITKPEVSAVSGWDGATITPSALIGMVSKVKRALVDEVEVPKTSLDAAGRETKQVFLQYSDLIEVVPVDLIEETIELAKSESLSES